MIMQARVKRGRRRIYERSRCGLKEGMEIEAMAHWWALEAVIRAGWKEKEYSLQHAVRFWRQKSIIPADRQLRVWCLKSELGQRKSLEPQAG